jgi:hypothetical protein
MMLFACHLGNGGTVGIFSDGRALPLAFSHDIDRAEAGLNAAFECFDTTDFFEEIFEGGDLDVGHAANNGLWAYEVEYPDGANEDVEGEWGHLRGGTFRRPTEEELEMLRGGDVLKGWVLL